MGVPAAVWGLTVVGIVGLLAFDYVFHVRKAHIPSLREAGVWSAAYVGIALLFGVGVLLFGGIPMGTEYFAGYVTEKALSVDNLFVFLLIMSAFKVPKIHQHRVLLFGILIALVLRGGFILAGAAVISRFSWVFYLFGAFLVLTAIKVMTSNDEDEEFHENAALRLVRRVLPVTEDYEGSRSFVRRPRPGSAAGRAGTLMVTPMLMVMIAIGMTDLLFALDSIPAIFGLTQEPYLVFAANMFALMGLRQLYFLLGGLLRSLVYLSYGLGVILAFIGVKLVLEALHTNTLSFLNGGQPVDVPTIGIELSLAVIVGVLAVTTVASLVKVRWYPDRPEPIGPAPSDEGSDEFRAAAERLRASAQRLHAGGLGADADDGRPAPETPPSGAMRSSSGSPPR